jgi:hypothetical protein
LGITFFGLGTSSRLGIRLGIKQAHLTVPIDDLTTRNPPYLLELRESHRVAMQKVESSSLFSRLHKTPAQAGVFLCLAMAGESIDAVVQPSGVEIGWQLFYQCIHYPHFADPPTKRSEER